MRSRTPARRAAKRTTKRVKRTPAPRLQTMSYDELQAIKDRAQVARVMHLNDRVVESAHPMEVALAKDVSALLAELQLQLRLP